MNTRGGGTAKGNNNSIKAEGKTLCLQQQHNQIPNRWRGRSSTGKDKVFSSADPFPKLSDVTEINGGTSIAHYPKGFPKHCTC